tara:strand:+ start:483 stop:1445 length:963 start_codon:yes stop_codon:yes gene_type:complete
MSNKNFKIWLGINVIMFIVFIYGGYTLYSQGFSDSSGISGYIVTMFIGLYLLNASNTLYFNRELALQSSSNMPIYDPDTNMITAEKEGLLSTHINNLSTIYKGLSHGSVTQDNSLDHIANGLFRREYFVQIGSNIMITLGLIGTIYGLIVAISGLEGVMTSLGSGSDDIIPGLKKALTGMGTAFYTTLFGAIFGGFFLKLMHQATINIAEELIDDISLTTEKYVLPYLRKTVEEHAAEQTATLTNYVRESKMLVRDEIDNMREYFSSINALSDGLEEFNELINRSTHDLAGNNLAILNEINNTLKAIQEDSRPIYKRLFA